MPTIARYKKYRIFFYSSDLQERSHVHVTRSKTKRQDSAKFWLVPDVSIFERGDFAENELKSLQRVLQRNRDLLLSLQENFRNGEHITAVDIN